MCPMHVTLSDFKERNKFCFQVSIRIWSIRHHMQYSFWMLYKIRVQITTLHDCNGLSCNLLDSIIVHLKFVLMYYHLEFLEFIHCMHSYFVSNLICSLIWIRATIHTRTRLGAVVKYCCFICNIYLRCIISDSQTKQLCTSLHFLSLNLSKCSLKVALNTTWNRLSSRSQMYHYTIHNFRVTRHCTSSFRVLKAIIVIFI